MLKTNKPVYCLLRLQSVYVQFYWLLLTVLAAIMYIYKIDNIAGDINKPQHSIKEEVKLA